MSILALKLLPYGLAIIAKIQKRTSSKFAKRADSISRSK